MMKVYQIGSSQHQKISLKQILLKKIQQIQKKCKKPQQKKRLPLPKYKPKQHKLNQHLKRAWMIFQTGSNEMIVLNLKNYQMILQLLKSKKSKPQKVQKKAQTQILILL